MAVKQKNRFYLFNTEMHVTHCTYIMITCISITFCYVVVVQEPVSEPNTMLMTPTCSTSDGSEGRCFKIIIMLCKMCYYAYFIYCHECNILLHFAKVNINSMETGFY